MPIAELIIQIVVGAVMAFLSAGATVPAQSAHVTSFIVGSSTGLASAHVKGLIDLLKGDDFGSTVEAAAIGLAQAVAISGFTSGLAYGMEVTKHGKKVSVSLSQAGDAARYVGDKAVTYVSTRVRAFLGMAAVTAPSSGTSSLASMITKQAFKTSAKKTASTGAGVAYGAVESSGQIAGVYSNGKMFIVRGGKTIMQDGVSLEEPLRIELHQENQKLLFERCEKNRDCLSGACGRLKRGDDELYCCDEVSMFGGYDYCEGTTVTGDICWFDEQCINEGK